MTFDPKAFKQQFPLFRHSSNRSLVYLDNAATTQKPDAVIHAIQSFYESINTNTDRSSHRLSRITTEMVTETRELAKRFLNATSASEIIFNRGATEGLNFLASSLCETLSDGDEIILSQAEHHANLLPWQAQAKRKNLKITFIPFQTDSLNLDRLPELISERTKLISITAASNTLGFQTDLTKIRKIIDGRQILLIVDAAQLAAHQSIDVTKIDCDFLVCSAHKFYGPTGIGLCYGKEHLLKELSPLLFGGEMITEVTLDSHELAPPPKRFEAGTLPLAEICGLKACLEFWSQQDRCGLMAHEQDLTKLLHSELSQFSELQLLSQPEENIGIANFYPHGGARFSANDLAILLDEQDIAVRHGQHCTQPLMQTLGVSSSVRASVSAYNDESDIEKLINALKVVFKLPSTAKSSSAQVNPAKGETNKEFSDDLSQLSLESLQAAPSWQNRYKKILQWGQAITEKPNLRTDQNKVTGCESATWLAHVEKDTQHFYALDSDSRIVKGLGALLLSQLNGQTREEIYNLDLDALFKELGLDKHLSPSRSNGFKAMMDCALSFLKD